MTSTWHEARVTKNDQRSKCQARVALPITLFGHFLLSANVSAQADPTIEWEVYNRFPFYKDANAFKDYSSVALKETGEIARGDWVLATEDRLQDSADAKGWAAKNFDTSKYNEPGAVCWNAPRKEYDICGGDPDYITPKSHVILATVQGTDPVGATCVWTLATPGAQPLKQSGSCAAMKISVPYSSTEGDQAPELSVSVQTNGSVGSMIGPVSVRVRDYLIVGMGDLFGAGVGNPDVPAQLDTGGASAISSIAGGYHGPPDPARSLPVRPGAGSVPPATSFSKAAPQWLNSFCFRSQYGPQLRAALHLAIAMPHSAVTFVGYSCSGARILEGLLSNKILDPGFAPQYKFVPPQLGQVAKLVCKPPLASQFELQLKYQQYTAKSCYGGKLFCDYSNTIFKNDP